MRESYKHQLWYPLKELQEDWGFGGLGVSSGFRVLGFEKWLKLLRLWDFKV